MTYGAAEAAPLQSKVKNLSFSAACEVVRFPKPPESEFFRSL